MRPTLQILRRALEPVPRRLLAAAVAAANISGANLWLVGGPVRDLAAGLPVRDLDFATDRDAGALAASFATRVRGTAHAEPRFGTARVDAKDYRVDFAALRTEMYVRPGALPSVRPGATLEADLARRDFTVNAMALGVAGPVRGRFVDPHGGLHDLASRRLRVLHADSFRDDATRLWRAARFAARLCLRPDRGTAHLIAEGAHWLDAISARRLWREFALVAAEPRAAEAVRTLDRWGVLAATHPALALGSEAQRALRRSRRALTPDMLFALLVAQRSPAERAAASTRIGAARSASRSAEDAARLLALSSDDPTDLDAVASSGEAARLAALLLDPSRQRALQGALRRWERTRPPLDARALLALGVPQGPALGAMLDWLRRERYVGNLDGAAAARRLVRTRLEQQGTHAAERATTR